MRVLAINVFADYFEIALLEVEAELDFDSVDHAVEGSIEVPSGRLVVMGCTDIFGQDPLAQLGRSSLGKAAPKRSFSRAHHGRPVGSNVGDHRSAHCNDRREIFSR